MYKAIIGGLFGLLLISTHATAQCSSYPYPLTNGTTANGSQVMSNFNCAALTSGATINAATLTGATALPGSGVINSSGYLGIGTTSPEGPLDVYSSSTNGTILTRLNDASSTAGSGIAIGALATNEPFVGFRVSDQSQRFQVNLESVNTSSERLAFFGDCGGGCGMTEYFSINKGGNVGIGTTSPSYTLHVNGSVAGTSAYNNLSDVRLKKNIVPLAGGLALIGQLQPIRFDWRTEREREVGKEFKLPAGRQIGFIAQEVGKVLPEAVSTANGKDAIMSVAESKVVPVLVAAMKELKAENDNQAAEIGRLETEVTALERKVRMQTAQR